MQGDEGRDGNVTKPSMGTWVTSSGWCRASVMVMVSYMVIRPWKDQIFRSGRWTCLYNATGEVRPWSLKPACTESHSSPLSAFAACLVMVHLAERGL